jgi:DNA-binding CsgD family transcriptional regulator
MLVTENICDYARSLSKDCDIDSAHVFISDKTTSDAQLYYLGNFGVDEEVLDRYHRHGIFNADPYLDVILNEGSAPNDLGFREPGHSHVARCGRRADNYWQFVAQEGIEVVGAATMRLQPRLYLTVGAHRAIRHTPRASVPFERLAFGIDYLQNKIASNLLSSLLAGGKGYRSLLNIVNTRAEPEASPCAALSARETEVARLVCEGKQNKEIAWLVNLSEYTVENHLRRIYQKLRIHNRAALVARMNGALA